MQQHYITRLYSIFSGLHKPCIFSEMLVSSCSPHDLQAGCEAQLSAATYLRYLCLAFTLSNKKSPRFARTFFYCLMFCQ
jgi:hypothetical protein